MKFFLIFLLLPIAAWGGLKLADQQSRTLQPAPVPSVQALNLPQGIQTRSLDTFRETPSLHTAAFFERGHASARPVPAKSEAIQPRVTAQALFRLNAVMRDGDNRVAAINGLIVSEGDRIDGYLIDGIESRQVWLRGPHGRERITFADTLTAAR